MKTNGEMVDGWHAVNPTRDEAGDRGHGKMWYKARSKMRLLM